MSAVELLEAIRPAVIARIVEGSPPIKLGLAPGADAGPQLEALLDRLVALVADPDPRRHLGFVTRWVASHLGEGYTPEDMVHAIVTLGDLMAQGVRGRPAAGTAGLGLIRDLARATRALVRLVVDVLGGELGRLDVASRETVAE
jgi:hypothetical protein